LYYKDYSPYGLNFKLLKDKKPYNTQREKLQPCRGKTFVIKKKTNNLPRRGKTFVTQQKNSITAP